MHMKKHRDLETSVVVVDQMIALDWLTSNTHNRPLRKDAVQKLAEDMRNGRWMDNGETIKFSAEGVLLDGQHRLMAIVESDVRLPLLVVRGLDEAAQATIDIGAVRTTGNILALNGIPNGNKIAALARVIIRYRETPSLVWSASSDPTKATIVEFSLEHSELLGMAAAEAHRARSMMSCNALGYGALAFLVHEDSRHVKRWEAWHEGVITGVNLEKGDARLSFRNYHQRRPSHTGGGWNSQQQVAIAIKAWNAFVSNKPAQVLRYSQSELPMPKVK